MTDQHNIVKVDTATTGSNGAPKKKFSRCIISILSLTTLILFVYAARDMYHTAASKTAGKNNHKKKSMKTIYSSTTTTKAKGIIYRRRRQQDHQYRSPVEGEHRDQQMQQEEEEEEELQQQWRQQQRQQQQRHVIQRGEEEDNEYESQSDFDLTTFDGCRAYVMESFTSAEGLSAVTTNDIDIVDRCNVISNARSNANCVDGAVEYNSDCCNISFKL